jgi:hypothetical protein
MDALKDAMDSESHLYSKDKEDHPTFLKKRSRVVSNDVIMSKIANTLVVNMSTFGESCMKKGDKQRTMSLAKLCELLNADPEIQSACNNIELKVDTVRQWIDRDSPLIAKAGFEAQKKAAKDGAEKVHGGPSKVQEDWMEAYNRYRAITATEESIGKESKGKLRARASIAGSGPDWPPPSRRRRPNRRRPPKRRGWRRRRRRRRALCLTPPPSPSAGRRRRGGGAWLEKTRLRLEKTRPRLEKWKCSTSLRTRSWHDYTKSQQSLRRLSQAVIMRERQSTRL